MLALLNSQIQAMNQFLPPSLGTGSAASRHDDRDVLQQQVIWADDDIPSNG